jgi:hypothetical protein
VGPILIGNRVGLDLDQPLRIDEAADRDHQGRRQELPEDMFWRTISAIPFYWLAIR